MKKLLIFAAAVAALAVAQADVLYWMVSDTYAQAADSSSGETFASLYVMDNGVLVASPIDTRSGTQVADAAEYGDYFTADISSYSGDAYSFYIELANGIKTSPESYDTLLSNGYIGTSSIGGPTSLSGGGFGQASGSATYNVPEPTSGLLFLVGGMLLGLKRRRQA